MKTGIIQSSYIPWRGYFDFIASVDVFVFHDDIQYTKGDWRNRNRIKTAQGLEWLTVPVYYKNVSQQIYKTEIDYSQSWINKHLGYFKHNYSNAKYVADAFDIISVIESQRFETISQLNITLINRICAYLGILTKTCMSAEFSLSGTKTDRLIDLLQKLDSTSYLSGPSADAYLDKEAFRRNNIQLEYKSYNYAPYPQLWGEFNGAVSVLDLIANCGPEAKNFIRSQAPDQIIIPIS